MYQQIKQPNLSVVGVPGMCLAYVTEVFGVAPKYPSATVGWQNAIQHTGTPPANAVPIWFKYNGPDGHVAVWDNGKIYSTTAQGDKTFNSIQELMNYIQEGIVYLGWSEDVNNVKVIEEETMSTIGPVEARILIKWIYGYTSETDIEGAIPALLGGESNTIIRRMDSTPTALAYATQVEVWKNAAQNSPTTASIPIVLKPGNYTVK